MRVMRRVGKNSLNDSFGQLSSPLILLFQHTYPHARLDGRSRLSVHLIIIQRIKSVDLRLMRTYYRSRGEGTWVVGGVSSPPFQ